MPPLLLAANAAPADRQCHVPGARPPPQLTYVVFVYSAAGRSTVFFEEGALRLPCLRMRKGGKQAECQATVSREQHVREESVAWMCLIMHGPSLCVARLLQLAVAVDGSDGDDARRVGGAQASACACA
eukprot:5253426-Pyramimonas_sp.AAC.1